MLDLHLMALERWGGSDGIRDPGMLDAAIAQPRATFDGDYRGARSPSHDGNLYVFR